MAVRLCLANASILSLTMAACGGGGGRDTVNSTPAPAPIHSVALPDPMPAPATKPTGENFDTAEYRNSSAAVGSNAIGAWQAGASGNGVTIGIVDTGIVTSLSDFSGRIHPASADVNGARPMDDVYGHGTAVAGIAAAARDGNGMQGIAFQATIFMARADQGCPSRCSFPLDAVARGIDAARMAGARVINLSIGGEGNDEVRDAARRAINAGIVLVIGAGTSGSTPSQLAREIAQLAPNQVIIVGGLGVSNPDGSINYDVPSIYTTPAGSSASTFLTAPGWLNSATYFNGGGIDRLSGTSFAAPVVSGALALLAEAFPMLTPQQMVLLLYKTADDLGVAGIDATFGQGRLNIERAFRPVGASRLANTKLPVPISLGMLPAAAGDAARHGGLRATILDDFERPFDVDLARSFRQKAHLGPLNGIVGEGNSSLASLAAGPVALAFTVDRRNAGQPLSTLRLTAPEARSARLIAATATAKLTEDLSIAFGVRARASDLRGDLNGRAGGDFLLSGNSSSWLGFGATRPLSLILKKRIGGWHLSGSAERGSVASSRPREPADHYKLLEFGMVRHIGGGHIRLGLSRLQESDTILGGNLDGLFGREGSKTWFLNAGIGRPLGKGWTIAASIQRGWTSLSSGRMATSAYSADLSRTGVFSRDDAIAIRVSQPLRVERGQMEIVLPASWDYKTETFTEALRSLQLAPSGRERVLEAGYLRHFQAGFVSLHLFHRNDPGHVDNNRSDVGAAFRARLEM